MQVTDRRKISKSPLSHTLNNVILHTLPQGGMHTAGMSLIKRLYNERWSGRINDNNRTPTLVV